MGGDKLPIFHWKTIAIGFSSMFMARELFTLPSAFFFFYDIFFWGKQEKAYKSFTLKVKTLLHSHLCMWYGLDILIVHFMLALCIVSFWNVACINMASQCVTLIVMPSTSMFQVFLLMCES